MHEVLAIADESTIRLIWAAVTKKALLFFHLRRRTKKHVNNNIKLLFHYFHLCSLFFSVNKLKQIRLADTIAFSELVFFAFLLNICNYVTQPLYVRIGTRLSVDFSHRNSSIFMVVKNQSLFARLQLIKNVYSFKIKKNN